MNENVSKFTTGTFSFSGTNINDLESSEYTLCVICLDSSYSIENFKSEMEKTVKSVISSCSNSPRSDNLMIRFVTFDRTVQEFHGFKELNKCVLSDYDNILNNLGGATALYDGILNSLESLDKYGKELNESDYSVNALLVTISDGDDNNSTFTVKSLKQKLQEIVGEKKLESLVSILVGVNTADAGMGLLLNNLAKETGMQYIDIATADAKSLAKLAQFISKSISSQSQALNTGAASKSLTF